jgi:uncharacterized protein (TIGR02679 family)
VVTDAVDVEADRPGVPPSLLEADLPAFWDDLGARLEKNGIDWRGAVRVDGLSSTGRLVLGSLVGTRVRSMVRLDAVEAGLMRLGVGATLADSLAALGRPIAPEPAARRADRARVAEGRAAARTQAMTWPEQWASAWIDDVIRSGVLAGRGPSDAAASVTSVRRLIDAIDLAVSDGPISRVDLAAGVIGSAHALDPDTLLDRMMTKALHYRRAGSETAIDDESDPWEQAGVHRSLVTGAALTWRLPVASGHPLHGAVQACSEAGVPFVVTQLAVAALGQGFEPGSDVLVAENPRVVEYAAQIDSPQAVICANGNPSATVLALLDRLAQAGVGLRYHGDFDSAGIDMCARMAARGVEPWRMTAEAYLTALDVADAAGLALPLDPRTCGPTPWDPDLGTVFGDQRKIVHEERLLASILER